VSSLTTELARSIVYARTGKMPLAAVNETGAWTAVVSVAEKGRLRAQGRSEEEALMELAGLTRAEESAR